MLKESVCFIAMIFGQQACPAEQPLNVQYEMPRGVVSVRAAASVKNGKTYVTGFVEKTHGVVTSAQVHLDIKAVRKGCVIESATADFSPSPIPVSRQGNRGKSTFGIAFKPVPPDTEIIVAVHHEPIKLCALR